MHIQLKFSIFVAICAAQSYSDMYDDGNMNYMEKRDLIIGTQPVVITDSDYRSPQPQIIIDQPAQMEGQIVPVQQQPQPLIIREDSGYVSGPGGSHNPNPFAVYPQEPQRIYLRGSEPAYPPPIAYQPPPAYAQPPPQNNPSFPPSPAQSAVPAFYAAGSPLSQFSPQPPAPQSQPPPAAPAPAPAAPAPAPAAPAPAPAAPAPAPAPAAPAAPAAPLPVPQAQQQQQPLSLVAQVPALSPMVQALSPMVTELPLFLGNTGMSPAALGGGIDFSGQQDIIAQSQAAQAQLAQAAQAAQIAQIAQAAQAAGANAALTAALNIPAAAADSAASSGVADASASAVAAAIAEAANAAAADAGRMDLHEYLRHENQKFSNSKEPRDEDTMSQGLDGVKEEAAHVRLEASADVRSSIISEVRLQASSEAAEIVSAQLHLLATPNRFEHATTTTRVEVAAPLVETARPEEFNNFHAENAKGAKDAKEDRYAHESDHETVPDRETAPDRDTYADEDRSVYADGHEPTRYAEESDDARDDKYTGGHFEKYDHADHDEPFDSHDEREKPDKFDKFEHAEPADEPVERVHDDAHDDAQPKEYGIGIESDMRTHAHTLDGDDASIERHHEIAPLTDVGGTDIFNEAKPSTDELENIRDEIQNLSSDNIQQPQGDGPLNFLNKNADALYSSLDSRPRAVDELDPLSYGTRMCPERKRLPLSAPPDDFVPAFRIRHQADSRESSTTTVVSTIFQQRPISITRIGIVSTRTVTPALKIVTGGSDSESEDECES